jgi:hypothetical protein
MRLIGQKETNKFTPEQTKAINTWCKWYSEKVGRINAGSKETYTGYEQDLFESLDVVKNRLERNKINAICNFQE